MPVAVPVLAAKDPAVIPNPGKNLEEGEVTDESPTELTAAAQPGNQAATVQLPESDLAAAVPPTAVQPSGDWAEKARNWTR